MSTKQPFKRVWFIAGASRGLSALSGFALLVATRRRSAHQPVLVVINLFVCGAFAFAVRPIMQTTVVLVSQRVAAEAVGTAAGLIVAAFNLGDLGRQLRRRTGCGRRERRHDRLRGCGFGARGAGRCRDVRLVRAPFGQDCTRRRCRVPNLSPFLLPSRRPGGKSCGHAHASATIAVHRVFYSTCGVQYKQGSTRSGSSVG